MRTKKCQFCGEDKKLIKAHIIPEIFYTHLYDENHKFSEIPTDGFAKKRSLGVYDANILCKECDEFIGKLDDYAAKVLWEWPPEKTGAQNFYNINDSRIQWISAKNVDSGKMKLFFLSILWRAHISQLEHFKDVDLGRDADSIKQMIKNHDPSSKEIFPVLLIHYLSKDVRYKSIISQILKYNKEGHTYYLALLGGFAAIWYENSRPLPKEFSNMIIASENVFTMLRSPMEAPDFLLQIIGEEDLKKLVLKRPKGNNSKK